MPRLPDNREWGCTLSPSSSNRDAGKIREGATLEQWWRSLSGIPRGPSSTAVISPTWTFRFDCWCIVCIWLIGSLVYGAGGRKSNTLCGRLVVNKNRAGRIAALNGCADLRVRRRMLMKSDQHACALLRTSLRTENARNTACFRGEMRSSSMEQLRLQQPHAAFLAGRQGSPQKRAEHLNHLMTPHWERLPNLQPTSINVIVSCYERGTIGGAGQEQR